MKKNLKQKIDELNEKDKFYFFPTNEILYGSYMNDSFKIKSMFSIAKGNLSQVDNDPSDCKVRLRIILYVIGALIFLFLISFLITSLTVEINTASFSELIVLTLGILFFALFFRGFHWAFTIDFKEKVVHFIESKD